MGRSISSFIKLIEIEGLNSVNLKKLSSKNVR
jgi:hypothetical protein